MVTLQAICSSVRYLHSEEVIPHVQVEVPLHQGFLKMCSPPTTQLAIKTHIETIFSYLRK